MKKLLTLTAAALLASAPVSVFAKESVTKNVALVTDYVWRGLSGTDNGPAIQGGVEYKKGNAYAGIWGTNVDDSGSTEGLPVEMDVFFGYNNQFDGFNLNTSVTTYNYLHNNGLDLTEFRVATNLEKVKGLELAINREIKNGYWYLEGNFEKNLPHRLYFDASAGYWNTDNADSALVASAQIARDFPEFHHVDVFASISYLSDETFNQGPNSNGDSEMIFFLGVRKNF